MGSTDVKIEISRSQSGGTFTNYDVLEGTVKLTVTTSISLNYIQVKLEGVSKTELTIPRDPRREKKDKILQDVHKVLYDTVIVFPPENIRQISKAKEFTLAPGTYTYPFKFNIPLNNSCVKVLGITNKVLLNVKKMDLRINNGNFNSNTVKNYASNYLQTLLNSARSNNLPSSISNLGGAASNYLQNHGGSKPQAQTSQAKQAYHVTTQLPPSLSGLGDFASVKYYVKVTCKRASVFKANLRAFDPFIFLPLDLNSHNEPFNSGDYEEYREAFVRKDIMFRNRIPEIIGVKMEKTLPLAPVQPKKKFLERLFDTPQAPPAPVRRTSPNNTPQVNASDVPFAFEIRFRHPAFLIPTKKPSFKLFLVSKAKPSLYSLAEYGKPDQSNGLGVVYLQKLMVELASTTVISVLENDGSVQEIHRSNHEDVISICNNTYQNLKFDLFDCKKPRSSASTSTSNLGPLYELEIPKKYFTNCVLPDYLSPSFRTCNIQRKYRLTVVGGFLDEKISDFKNQAEIDKKVRFVDLQVHDVKVLSGLSMTSSLQAAAPGGSIAGSSLKTGSETSLDVSPPKLPRRPSVETGSSTESVSLPTYDDVVRESSYQNDSDHQRARRRYQQHEQYYNNLED